MREARWWGRLAPATIAAAALLAFLPAGAASGAETCYDESTFPAVFHLERRGTWLRAYLGPTSRRTDLWLDPSRVPVPVRSYDPSHGWSVSEDAPIPRRGGDAPPCAGLLPAVELTVEQAILLRPHIAHIPPEHLELHPSIGACHQVDGVIWFGISFYEGEGSDGMGGVGRYDLATKQLEVSRPQELRDASVGHLVHDGEALWIATHGRYECVGHPPVSGLLRYDWNKSVADRQDVCGFVYHGMVLLDGDLWVASDLGLARGIPGRFGLRTWQNFVATADRKEGVREISCAGLYESLLVSLPTTATEGYSPWSLLFQNLAKFRPEFLADYVRQQQKKECPTAPTPAIP